MRSFKKRPYSREFKILVFLALFNFAAVIITAVFQLYLISIITFIGACIYMNLARKLPIRRKFKPL